MNILALDLSLTGTGVCLPDGSTTTIKTANLRGPERLRYIRDQVRDYTYLDIKVCIIEGYSYGSAQGACNIGELGGVIRVLLFERDIPIVEIAPKSRAKYATGNGNADKGASSTMTTKPTPGGYGRWASRTTTVVTRSMCRCRRCTSKP
jgi:hypothetical protein